MWVLRLRAAIPVALACVALASCAEPSTVRTPDESSHLHTSRRDSRVWALLINGGGSKAKNYQSHLMHLRSMLDFLATADIPKRRIEVFTSDGADPAPDLAVRDAQPEKNFWLIQDIPVGRRLRTELRYENTRIEGVRVHAATQHDLNQWAASHRPRLKPGDTLFVYVTDHGTKNAADLDNNSIVLWGEDWSVSEFRGFLDKLRKDVRVVLLMSQCFSGSFANTMYASGEPTRILGNVCGYFSSSPTHRAYGCYPENLGKNNVGHSFRFLEALNTSGNLGTAHGEVTRNDRTPDVPNRTTDLLLQRILERAAAERGKSFRVYADELLRQAWRDEVHSRGLFKAIDAVGTTFSISTPRTLTELLEQTGELPRLASELNDHAHHWRNALTDLERENFERFLGTNEFWRGYLSDTFLDELSDPDKRKLSRWLLTDLQRYIDTDAETSQRLQTMHTMTVEAAAAAYRMEVRRAAAERMRHLLVRIAGLVHLDRYGSNTDRRDYEALSECENLRLTKPRRVSAKRASNDRPFPSLAQEAELLEAVRPGWLGIEFEPVATGVRGSYGLALGASTVTRVLPESPADTAGIHTGDIIVGPPGRPFRDRNQLREWVMTALVGQDQELTILRSGLPMSIVVRVGAAPL